MKKFNINKVYESHLPPEDTSVLWADIDDSTGELRAIHKFIDGEWLPYIVSVDYMKPDEGDLEGSGASIEVLDSPSAIRITNVSDSLMSYQLIQIVIPDSPIYGEFEGTQTRVHVVSESNPTMGSVPEDYQGELELVDMILGFRGSRNGFPFSPETYGACKLRIVPTEDDLEITSDTTTWDGGVPSVKFIKYKINLNN